MHDTLRLAFAPLAARAEATAPDARRDRISLRDHVVAADIGAFTHERGLPQRLRFDAVVEVPRPAQPGGDDVDAILSYDAIVAAIDDALAAGRVDLLETLAEAIAARLLAEPKALRVFLRIQKLDRGPGALGVEIERSRADTPPPPPAPELPAPLVVHLDTAARPLPPADPATGDAAPGDPAPFDPAPFDPAAPHLPGADTSAGPGAPTPPSPDPAASHLACSDPAPAEPASPDRTGPDTSAGPGGGALPSSALPSSALPEPALPEPDLAARLDGWLALGAPVVLVPGLPALPRPRSGDGPTQWRIDLLAMEQNAWALAARDARCVVAASRAELLWALRQGHVAVWAPARMVLDAADAPTGPAATPAALARWLAGTLRATRLIEAAIPPDSPPARWSPPR